MLVDFVHPFHVSLSILLLSHISYYWLINLTTYLVPFGLRFSLLLETKYKKDWLETLLWFYLNFLAFS
jgi:hypothetical protein